MRKLKKMLKMLQDALGIKWNEPADQWKNRNESFAKVPLILSMSAISAISTRQWLERHRNDLLHRSPYGLRHMRHHHFLIVQISTKTLTETS